MWAFLYEGVRVSKSNHSCYSIAHVEGTDNQTIIKVASNDNLACQNWLSPERGK